MIKPLAVISSELCKQHDSELYSTVATLLSHLYLYELTESVPNIFLSSKSDFSILRFAKSIFFLCYMRQ